MRSPISAKVLAAATLATAGFVVASAAHARSEVYFSIGVPAAPVYVEPSPLYVQPRPIYVQPPVYTAPAEVFVRRGPPEYGYSYEDERAWRRAEWRRRHWRHHHDDWERYRSHSRYWD